MIDAKRKAMIFLSIAFVLAIVASVLVLNEIRQAQTSVTHIKVAVAKQDIPTYTKISPDMIDWVEIPETGNIYSFILSESDLENEIVIVNVQAGDLLTRNILRSMVDIPPDHRVILLNATNNVTVDQQVAEGDLVDLIVTHDEEDGSKTERLFENVSVVQKTDGDKGRNILISMDISDAVKFIHYQHKAEYIRVLLVNQIQNEPNADDSSSLEGNNNNEEDSENDKEDDESNEDNGGNEDED